MIDSPSSASFRLAYLQRCAEQHLTPIAEVVRQTDHGQQPQQLTLRAAHVVARDVAPLMWGLVRSQVQTHMHRHQLFASRAHCLSLSDSHYLSRVLP